jgi:anaphase-promoting complex subunit 5
LIFEWLSDGVNQRSNQVASAIEPLLKALWQSEFQGRLHLYRVAVVLMADIGLEFGMTKGSRRILEEIFPQVCDDLSE